MWGMRGKKTGFLMERYYESGVAYRGILELMI